MNQCATKPLLPIVYYWNLVTQCINTYVKIVLILYLCLLIMLLHISSSVEMCKALMWHQDLTDPVDYRGGSRGW